MSAAANGPAPVTPAWWGYFIDPSVGAVAVAISVGILLRRVFLAAETWLWKFAAALRLSDLTPWARTSTNDRDGAEPYGLLALVILAWLMTAAGCWVLKRIAPAWRAAVVACLLGIDGLFAWWVPLRPPMAVVELNLQSALLVVAASLAAGLLLMRTIQGRTGVPALLVVLLIPVCFVHTTVASLEDIISILSPALRLQHGFPVGEVYLQYDLLPSLLALGWSKVGGAPLAFTFVTSTSFYLLMLGMFVFARRTFRHPKLAAPLLVCVVLVRFYAVMADANAVPQVTPIRLDLWLLVLWAVYTRGLQSWLVGLTLGALYFFSRSIGTLYLGAYGLAVGADFLARRCSLPRSDRPAFFLDVRRLAVAIAPAIALIGLSFVCVRLVFGSFSSDAVSLYRHLGIGMLRITATSFYWWLLPLTGATGWLAFSRRGSVADRYGQMAIAAVALMVANSIYFFGRSHEHNLINISASVLFVLFVGLDLAWPSADQDGDRVTRIGFRWAPWMLVAVCAYFYSGRVTEKIVAQRDVLFGQHSPPPAIAHDILPSADCDEITHAAGDDRVYLFSKYDYWYYTACGFIPQGYVQPFNLAVMKGELVGELNRMLDRGIKIVLPRQAGDWSGFFPEFVAPLGHPSVTETAHFQIYRRQSGSSG
ncbi:MAG TPA: hypothetical protein VGL59_08605 [Polyangia bacterium]|jgi:hypothetical protein